MHARTTESLDRDECLELMKRRPSWVGRVAVLGPRPESLPVDDAIGRVVARVQSRRSEEAFSGRSEQFIG
jgi:hypothetical protein